MPWYVGRFNDINSYNTGGSDGGFANMVGKDIEWCKNVNESGESKVQYAPHCYPGASDLNMHPYYERDPAKEVSSSGLNSITAFAEVVRCCILLCSMK